ncbi:hypothetical protein [Olleya sp. YS]|uniref:hypothetical protein n=1 Tax=Olleya sp. YS TaxID=3028318 RepID=UPI0024341794|nr:hypothetical protein [Olleya sp. YS]WGD33736.1 hypothetical protein Ollyesu_08085 [Olleya sp. YS]
MKNLYNINKTLIIINIILGFTIYLGLLFLIPLGIVQIIMAMVMIANEKKITKEIYNLLSVYCITTTVILIGFFFMYTSFLPSNDGLFLIMMIVSVLLAFLNLYITSLVDVMIKTTNENLKIKKEITI